LLGSFLYRITNIQTTLYLGNISSIVSHFFNRIIAGHSIRKLTANTKKVKTKISGLDKSGKNLASPNIPPIREEINITPHKNFDNTVEPIFALQLGQSRFAGVNWND